jgi:hypothetical protein
MLAKYGETRSEIPEVGRDPPRAYYQKQKARKKFCLRAGIESVTGHLKQDRRRLRSYLKGNPGDAINTMMAVAGYNFEALAEQGCFCPYFNLQNANN